MGRLLHGLEVRPRRRAVRADVRRLLPRRHERRHLPLRLHRRRADAGRDPRAFPIGSLRVRFSSAGSGGVAWEWDFGDGQTSTEANPTHTYAEAKRYTATLTVTYADGAKDSKTVDVDVLAQADETRAGDHGGADPPSPGTGGTYTRPVTVTLTATDAAGGSGVDTTEYRINGGDWLDYEARSAASSPAMYLIEFRSTDRTGNVEATKSVTLHDRGRRTTARRTSTTSSTGRARPEVDDPAPERRGARRSRTARCGSRSATAT